MSTFELSRFAGSIDAAWEDLRSFLAAVTPDQALKRDQAGWSVKDHVVHLAAWEDSVDILFRGGFRHEALGIEESFFAAGNIDEINEVIKVRLEGTTPEEALRSLEGTHERLMGHLSTLRDADLEAKAREFFPQAPRNDERLLAALIWANTGGHFAEHLAWMRDLVGRAA